MKQAVNANPDAEWKVVAFHQAPYSEAKHDGSTASDDDTMFMRNNWTKLMDQYGVDIVLNGHDHYYTRSYQMYGGSAVDTTKTNSVTNPKGTVYFTLDSGSGSKYYKYNTTADHSFSAFGWQNNEPSYTYAKVDGNQFTLTTYSVSSDTPIDTYTITKTNQKSSGGTSATTPVATVSNPQTGDNGTGSYRYVILAAAALVLAAGCAVFLMKKETRSN
jgi:3',5'-cyclic AMP phosphodiesterase CpdA